MASVKEWEVAVNANTDHMYTVIARTPEEAESIAEDLLRSGDNGAVLEEPDILSSQAVPSDGTDEVELAELTDEDDVEFEE